LLPKWLACWGARFFARKASLVVTNVPGPQEALHVGGIRLAHVHFWVPHPATLGLGVSILSYAGEVRMGVRADAAVRPVPNRLVRRIERELDHVLSSPLRSMPGEWKEGAPSWNA
jgi:diacylglycerol O-acyltransferase